MIKLTEHDEFLIAELKALKDRLRVEVKWHEAQAISKARYVKHLTDDEIGQKFGVSRSRISRICSSKELMGEKK